MKLHIGQPPATPNFPSSEDGWTPLKERNPWVLQMIATPIGIIAGMLTAWAWGPFRFEAIAVPATMFGQFTPLVIIVAMLAIGLPPKLTRWRELALVVNQT